jgi:hypothetical protein
VKKIILLVFILHLLSFNTYANYYYKIQEPTDFQSKYVNFWVKQCEYIEEDIPTIFIPWILASWYSEDWYKEKK